MAATLSPRRREGTSARACCSALSKVSPGSLVPRCELNAGTATTAIPAGADKIESCLSETPLSPVLPGASGTASGRLLHLQYLKAGARCQPQVLGCTSPSSFCRVALRLPPSTTSLLTFAASLVSLEPDFSLCLPSALGIPSPAGLHKCEPSFLVPEQSPSTAGQLRGVTSSLFRRLHSLLSPPPHIRANLATWRPRSRSSTPRSVPSTKVAVSRYALWSTRPWYLLTCCSKKPPNPR